MKKLKLLALLPLLVLTSCTKANTKRVENLIFEYTEHMEQYESVETNDGADFYYLGNSTLSATEDGLTAIFVSRFDEDKKNLAALGLMGELNDGLFEDGSFVIDELGLFTYSVEKDNGYSVVLETAGVPSELVTVNFNDYFEELKTLTYDDLVYALEKLK
jgi:hypothetical protein